MPRSLRGQCLKGTDLKQPTETQINGIEPAGKVLHENESELKIDDSFLQSLRPEPACFAGPIYLEFVLQSELQLAIRQVGAGDFPKVTISEESVRIRELWCVERIEKLCPKLQRMTFAVRHLERLAK